MLVLTRKQNQEILIGDNIKITVLKMKGNTVRLGIEAPRDINVVRGELPRHETAAIPVEEPEQPQIAEFTVVFSNTDESQGAKVDVIPFEPDSTSDDVSENEDSPRSTQSPNQSGRPGQERPPSIQFRGKLPEQLHHNRLKEIVNQLTARTERSSV